jgi:hypothetical protein
MFAATGANSLGLIKSLQREKLIAPGKYKNANGKLSRAWGAGDLFRIALAVDLAEETGFSLFVSAKILGVLGPAKIDFVLSTELIMSEIHARLQEAMKKGGETTVDGLPVGWRELLITIPRRDLLDIQIVDRHILHCLTYDTDGSGLSHETPLGCLSDAKGNSPQINLTENQALSSPHREERSILTVRLSHLADLPLHEAFGVVIHPEFVA